MKLKLWMLTSIILLAGILSADEVRAPEAIQTDIKSTNKQALLLQQRIEEGALLDKYIKPQQQTLCNLILLTAINQLEAARFEAALCGALSNTSLCNAAELDLDNARILLDALQKDVEELAKRKEEL